MPDPNNDASDFDDQSLAETFDEENITADGRDIATSDMQRDLFDATSVPEDANEALEPEDDFDPDQADEAELEEIVLADEDLDEPRSFVRDDADLVAEDDAQPADYEPDGLAPEDLVGDVEALGYGADAVTREAVDAALDEALALTFPASDPVSISRRSP
ncbi:MAG TPA: hypothetical protein VN694_09445 [Caulobacteraceae bacterium]|nr:hypothetical protein [Caulobacteraceae bacterium]